MTEAKRARRRTKSAGAGAALALALAAGGVGCGTAGAGVAAEDYAFEAGLLNPPDDAWRRRPRPPTAAVAPPRAASSPRAQLNRRIAPAPPAPPQPARVARATPPPAAPVAPPQPTPPPARQPAAPATEHLPRDLERVRATQRLDAATAMLGSPGLRDRAFVAHVLKAAGQDLVVDRNVPYARALWDKLQQAGQTVDGRGVRPGDLVFFRDTTDLNGNGRPDDGVTLVGVVESAHGARVLFIAQRAGKVRRMAVDPTRPLVVRDAQNQVVNTRLVRWPGSSTPWTTGQCLTGYARPDAH